MHSWWWSWWSINEQINDELVTNSLESQSASPQSEVTADLGWWLVCYRCCAPAQPTQAVYTVNDRNASHTAWQQVIFKQVGRQCGLLTGVTADYRHLKSYTKLIRFRWPVPEISSSEISKNAASWVAILDMVQHKVGPFDQPSQKTLP